MRLCAYFENDVENFCVYVRIVLDRETEHCGSLVVEEMLPPFGRDDLGENYHERIVFELRGSFFDVCQHTAGYISELAIDGLKRDGIGKKAFLLVYIPFSPYFLESAFIYRYMEGV